MDNNNFDNKDLNYNGEIQNDENQNTEIRFSNNQNSELQNYETANYETLNDTTQGSMTESETNADSMVSRMDTVEYERVDAQANQVQQVNTGLVANNNPYNSGYDNQDTARTSSFYTETLKKPNRTKNASIKQLVLVALMSSLMGGAFVAAFFQFVVPTVQPSTKSFFSSIIPNDNLVNSGDKKDAAGVAQKLDTNQDADAPVTDIAEKVSPSIVGISVTNTSRSQGYFFFQQQQAQPSEGSGIIIKSDGYIMTNFHVIENALNSSGKVSSNAKIQVILPNQKDKPYTAQLVGGDKKTDLAVLKIDGTNLPAVTLGNSDNIKVGELAVAIGNPAGLEYMGSVTVGVISGLNRTIPIEDGKELKLIQTDAAINPGNSGGALLNSKGQVIGINTAKIGANGYEGLGFAIPINKAKEVTDSLMQYKYVKGRALLGIEADGSFTEDVAKQYDVPVGVLVKNVTPFSGAYKAGIQAGDIITKFKGKAVKSTEEINEIKASMKPGDIVDVEVYRDGETKTLKVTLSEDKGTVN